MVWIFGKSLWLFAATFLCAEQKVTSEDVSAPTCSDCLKRRLETYGWEADCTHCLTDATDSRCSITEFRQYVAQLQACYDCVWKEVFGDCKTVCEFCNTLFQKDQIFEYGTSCGEGSYPHIVSDDFGNGRECSLCPFDTYKNATQPFCVDCIDGTITFYEGALKPSDCVREHEMHVLKHCYECVRKKDGNRCECQHDCWYFLSTIDTREQCLNDSRFTKYGLKCGEGHYPDYFDVANSELHCTKCPLNSFKSSSQEFCRNCPNGFLTLQEGSTGKKHCLVACEAGSYWDESRQRCQRCPFDTYQDQDYQTTCKPCPSCSRETEWTDSLKTKYCTEQWKACTVTTSDTARVSVTDASTDKPFPTSVAIALPVTLVAIIVALVVVSVMCVRRRRNANRLTNNNANFDNVRDNGVNNKSYGVNTTVANKHSDVDENIKQDMTYSEIKDDYDTSQGPYQHLHNNKADTQNLYLSLTSPIDAQSDDVHSTEYEGLRLSNPADYLDIYADRSDTLNAHDTPSLNDSPEQESKSAQKPEAHDYFVLKKPSMTDYATQGNTGTSEVGDTNNTVLDKQDHDYFVLESEQKTNDQTDTTTGHDYFKLEKE